MKHGGNELTTTAEQIEQFFQGGAAAAKFPDREYGTVIGGEIVADPRMQQQRDYTTGDPITYQDGNPAMQMVIVVQTSLHDPSIPEDDGQRAFYVKGQMRQAIGEALKKAGATAPRRGGKLWLKYIEDKPTTLRNGKPGNPQKIYAAKYEPPAQAAAGQFFDESEGMHIPAGDPAADRTSSPPTTRGGGGLERPPSIPPASWQAMSADQQRQIVAALAGAPPANGGTGFRDEPPF
jgi:hypothetical protein